MIIITGTCPISISDIFKPAINFTIHIKRADMLLITIPKTKENTGTINENAIFKYPSASIIATKGKTVTVQRLVSGLIV